MSVVEDGRCTCHDPSHSESCVWFGTATSLTRLCSLIVAACCCKLPFQAALDATVCATLAFSCARHLKANLLAKLLGVVAFGCLATCLRRASCRPPHRLGTMVLRTPCKTSGWTCPRSIFRTSLTARAGPAFRLLAAPTRTPAASAL